MTPDQIRARMHLTVDDAISNTSGQPLDLLWAEASTLALTLIAEAMQPREPDPRVVALGAEMHSQHEQLMRQTNELLAMLNRPRAEPISEEMRALRQTVTAQSNTIAAILDQMESLVADNLYGVTEEQIVAENPECYHARWIGLLRRYRPKEICPDIIAGPDCDPVTGEPPPF